MKFMDIIKISALQSKAGIKVELNDKNVENAEKILQALEKADMYACQKEYIFRENKPELIGMFQTSKESLPASEWDYLLKTDVDFTEYEESDFAYMKKYRSYIGNVEQTLNLSKLSKKLGVNLVYVYRNLYEPKELWQYDVPLIKKAAALRNINIDVMRVFQRLCEVPYMWELMQFISGYYSENVSFFDEISDEPRQILNSLVRCNLQFKPTVQEMRWFMYGLKKVNFDLTMIKRVMKANPEHLPSSIYEILDVAFGNRYHDLIEKADRRGLFFICQVLADKKYKFLDKLQQSKFMEVGHLESRILEDTNKVKIFNLNEFSVEDINLIGFTDVKIDCDAEQKLTPKEFIILNNSGVKYAYRIYKKLEGSIDTKILNFRQLINAGVYNVPNDFFFERVNKELFQSWKNDFSFKLQNHTLIKRLSLDPKYDALVGECRTEAELSFVCRNYEMLDADKFLSENMNHFMENDKSCIRLMELLQLPDEFIREHADTIKQFCIDGDAEIAVTYYNNAAEFQQEALLKIVKAELADKMERFKFFNLEREIEIDDNPDLIEAWKNNITLSRGKYTGFESYSFHDTMMIGVLPGHTCMSYKDGMYNNCLLANFDSNKKVIFVRRNEDIVGRAIIRLTKYLNEDEVSNNKVAFLDISKEQKMTDFSEKCTVYIEKVYTSGVNSEEETIICNLIADMVKEKMQNVNCMVMGCSDYKTAFNSRGTKKVFISHTKNREQYMDSFGGENNASNEAKYISCTAYYDEES